MSTTLENKNIVIIGGTSGIGLSAAKAFVKEGANLVVVGNNNIDEAKSVLGKQVIVQLGDACSAQCSVLAIATCLDHYSGFDGLFHVAGGSGRKMGDGPLHELSLEGWNKTLELNLTSLMLSNQAAINAFIKTGKGGSILNMGSVLANHPAPEYFATHAYAAAKSAIEGFSKSIASYYAPNNIRVNVVAPALIQSPMSVRALSDDHIMRFVKSRQALGGGRIGLPEDIDGLAIYFMSDLSKFTTGQVVSVDGGWSVR